MESLYNLFNQLDDYVVLDYLVWICFFIYCITFNKRQTHWFNVISVLSCCLILWFVDIDDYNYVVLVSSSLIFLLLYAVLNKKFGLNQYILGNWGEPFIDFIQKPSFKHRNLSFSSSCNLIIHFVLFKLLITYLLLYPLSDLSVKLFSIQKHYDKDLDDLLKGSALYLFAITILWATWEELQFRFAFRKPTLNLGIYLVVIIPLAFDFSSYYILPFLLLYWILSKKISKRFYVKNLRWFVLISALLFGLAHHNGNVQLFDLLGYIMQIFGGLCYLWLRIRFGLTYAIVAHSLSNLLLMLWHK